jgi:hypothetical protein
MAAKRHFNIVRHSIKILNPGGKKRIRSLGVCDLRATTSGQLQTFRSLLIDELLL